MYYIFQFAPKTKSKKSIFYFVFPWSAKLFYLYKYFYKYVLITDHYARCDEFVGKLTIFFLARENVQSHGLSIQEVV